MNTTQLTTEQIQALKKVKQASLKFYSAMAGLSKAWNELENKDAPIGFMDTMYPFSQRFDHETHGVQLWNDHIAEKVNQIIHGI